MIETWSHFDYGFDVGANSKFLQFQDGSDPVITEIPLGNYTISDGLAAVRAALNSSGEQAYSVTIDRETRLVTISAENPFDLVVNSGSSILPMLGFQIGEDLTGQNSYTGANPLGFRYSPQFKLQSYVPPEHFQDSVDATVNQSADGRIEIVRFGIRQKIEMNIRFITNRTFDDTIIRNNPNGVRDAVSFLSYITQKKRFEFFPNEDDKTLFYKVILESISGYSNGTGFKLREMLTENLADIYETGLMQLRVVE